LGRWEGVREKEGANQYHEKTEILGNSNMHQRVPGVRIREGDQKAEGRTAQSEEGVIQSRGGDNGLMMKVNTPKKKHNP